MYFCVSVFVTLAHASSNLKSLNHEINYKKKGEPTKNSLEKNSDAKNPMRKNFGPKNTHEKILDPRNTHYKKLWAPKYSGENILDQRKNQ